MDSEKPIRSDWPAVHISECFVDGERAKIHGSVRPLRTFLPPTVVFRNAADIDEDIPEPELNVPNASNHDGTVELVPSAKGITVKRVKKDTKEGKSSFLAAKLLVDFMAELLLINTRNCV